ncbi:hypothetical protein IJT10_01355 [bacterium]|nr:hypothetical protein [bacterium]
MKTPALNTSFVPINTSTSSVQRPPKSSKSLPPAEPENQDKVELHTQTSSEVSSKAKSGKPHSKTKTTDASSADKSSSIETKNEESKSTQSESSENKTDNNSKQNNTPEAIALLEDEPVLSISLKSTEETSKKAKTRGASQSKTSKNKVQGGETKSTSFSDSTNEVKALREELQQQDMLRTQGIYERMSVEKQLHEAKRQAIQADLQTELQKIWREVNLRRQKVEDDLNKNWQKIFLGS